MPFSLPCVCPSPYYTELDTPSRRYLLKDKHSPDVSEGQRLGGSKGQLDTDTSKGVGLG